MHRDVAARASRRLVAAVVLILLPAVVLGYFGVRAVAEKEIGLRTTYTATTGLVRDRLAAELTHLESALAIELARPAARLDDPAAVSAWLRTLAAARPWLAEPFLLQLDGGVTTIDLGDDGARVAIDAGGPANLLETLPELAAAIRGAEAAEFVDGRLDRALEQYRQTLASAPSDAARGLVRMRLGRTLFKLRRFDEGIAQYRAVLALPPGTRDPHGTPYAVNALLQIADGLEALGRPNERPAVERQLLQFVVDHPWAEAEAEEDGYEYYVARAVESAPSQDEALRSRARALIHAAGAVRWIQREIRPRVERDVNGGGWTETAARRFVVPRDAQSVFIGCVALPAISGDSVRAVLGYEIRPEYVAGPLLASVLKGVDLGPELRVEVAPASGPAPLAQADLGAVLPGWRVGLFHRDNKSIDQLVARERWIYGTLIVGLVVVLIVGVTFTMRASAREAELSRLKTEFVSNVSHELKTPLALIRMFGETLESGIVTDEAKRQEFYAIIRRESDRLTHLINNVLDVARIDAGTKQYAFLEGDAVALVREVIEAYQPLFDRLGFAVETVLPASPIIVSMDRDALARALVNLFQNVVKYSGDVKKVAVSVGVRDGMARLSVADQGVGIAREEVQRIFEAHYRVMRLDDGAVGSAGSGLGLAIVKHAMEAHGGCVEVESTPDRGSVFTLVVPVRDAGA
jgi:signal transduction histidine kinase